jgi:hypothetical protein
LVLIREGSETCGEKINLPSLEAVASMHIWYLPLLHSINIPKVKDIESLRLVGLPSLKTFSFGPDLQTMGGLTVGNTSLTSIGGLTLRKTSTLDIVNNKNLTTISYPFLTVIVFERYLRSAGIWVSSNSDNFLLDLLKLKGIQRKISLSGIAAVNILELTYIDEELNIGAISF